MNFLPTRRHRLCAAALATLVAAAHAQSPQTPPALPTPPAPLAAPAEDATTRLDGVLRQWLINPDGDVDGLLLGDGTQVAFPPHLSARVVAAATLSDKVQLTGWREGAVFRASQIMNPATGRVVRDDGPPAPPAAPRPPVLQPLSATGRIATLLGGPRGEVDGVVLQGGEIVRFPPHVGRQYAELLRRGATLYARGYGTRNAYGTAFEATALGDSADGAREVFAGPPPMPRPRDGAPPPPLQTSRAGGRP